MTGIGPAVDRDKRKRALKDLSRGELEDVVLRLQDMVRAARAEVSMAREEGESIGGRSFYAGGGPGEARNLLDRRGKALAASLQGVLPESARFALVLEEDGGGLAVFASAGPAARDLLGRGLDAIPKPEDP